jgi:hypothetical protein
MSEYDILPSLRPTTEYKSSSRLKRNRSGRRTFLLVRLPFYCLLGFSVLQVIYFRVADVKMEKLVESIQHTRINGRISLHHVKNLVSLRRSNSSAKAGSMLRRINITDLNESSSSFAQRIENISSETPCRIALSKKSSAIPSTEEQKLPLFVPPTNATFKWEYVLDEGRAFTLQQIVREHAVSYGLNYTEAARRRWQAQHAGRAAPPFNMLNFSKIKRIWIWGMRFSFVPPPARRPHLSPPSRAHGRRALLVHHSHHGPARKELRPRLPGPDHHQQGEGGEGQSKARVHAQVRHRWPPMEARCAPCRPVRPQTVRHRRAVAVATSTTCTHRARSVYRPIEIAIDRFAVAWPAVNKMASCNGLTLRATPPRSISIILQATLHSEFPPSVPLTQTTTPSCRLQREGEHWPGARGATGY